jgi:hypothetical protein
MCPQGRGPKAGNFGETHPGTLRRRSGNFGETPRELWGDAPGNFEETIRELWGDDCPFKNLLNPLIFHLLSDPGFSLDYIDYVETKKRQQQQAKSSGGIS